MTNDRLRREDFLTGYHGAFNLFRLLASHALLILAFWALAHFPRQGWGFLMAMICSLIHQRTISEWIHEAAHFNLVPSRKWNDVSMNGLGGWLFANDIKMHRAGHMQHHRVDRFFTSQDPDTHHLFVLRKSEFWKGVLQDIVGYTAFRRFFTTRVSSINSGANGNRSRYFYLQVILMQLIVIMICLKIGAIEYYVAYYLTLVTFYFLMDRIRVYGQHAEIDPQSGLAHLENSKASRTILGGFLDRLMITSELMMYHHEHHEFPALPFRALQEICPHSDDRNAFARSRWALIGALVRGLN